MKPSPELFDGQAHAFDGRAGLEPAQCQQIADAVVHVGAVAATGVIVEIGAGTGQIGAWLAAARRYVGLDLSSGMLQRFRERSRASAIRCGLVRADANHGWPIASGVVDVVFSSRALHLLHPDHVAVETVRASRRAGATLIVGRVERSPTSVRARLAREMRRRLGRAGFESRGDQHHRRVIDACVARGAVPLDPVTVITWTAVSSARESLDNWRRLPGLGGVEVPDAIRETVLRELEGWATMEFGRLDQRVESREAYVLTPVRVVPAS